MHCCPPLPILKFTTLISVQDIQVPRLTILLYPPVYYHPKVILLSIQMQPLFQKGQ